MSLTERLQYAFDTFQGQRRLSKGLCPHCGHRVVFEPPSTGGGPSWSFIERLDDSHGAEPVARHSFVVGICSDPDCARPTVVYELTEWADQVDRDNERTSHRVIFPDNGTRHATAPAVPEEIRRAYAEAGRIEQLSPNGSAFLARRLLEHMLRTHIGTKEHLGSLIGTFVEKVRLPSDLAEMMEAVRHFGNIAAHPGTTDDGTLVDVEAGEAGFVLDLVGELLDFLYVQPARRRAMKERREAKVAGENVPPLGRASVEVRDNHR